MVVLVVIYRLALNRAVGNRAVGAPTAIFLNIILYSPFDASKDCMSYSQWISFLSKNGVREIIISNLYSGMDITSYIFRCSKIVSLFLLKGSFNPPPTDFAGFPNLRKLALYHVHFNRPNVLCSLIENCKMLEELELICCLGMDHVVLDLPRLQTLRLIGHFESVVFRNVRCLKRISVHSSNTLTMPKKHVTGESVDALHLLASSCQLRYINFNDRFCKYFAASGNIRPSSVAFNHLNELRLRNLSLSDLRVFRYLMSMIECCPYIKKLDISFKSREIVGQDDIVDFNYNYKLDHLRDVIISGFTGSSAELKLVEYLLAISTVLENLLIKRGKLIESEPMLIALMGFPRASSKARLLFL